MPIMFYQTFIYLRHRALWVESGPSTDWTISLHHISVFNHLITSYLIVPSCDPPTGNSLRIHRFSLLDTRFLTPWRISLSYECKQRQTTALKKPSQMPLQISSVKSHYWRKDLRCVKQLNSKRFQQSCYYYYYWFNQSDKKCIRKTSTECTRLK